MNLQNLARYVILIWLPLASLEVTEKRPRGKAPNPDEVRIIEIGKRKDEEAGLELILEHMNRGIVGRGNRASHVSPVKISAKTTTATTVPPSLSGREASRTGDANEKAHRLIPRIKRDPSALHVISNISNVRNTSAAVMLPDKTENETRFKYLREWMRKRKRRKKRGLSLGGKGDGGKVVVERGTALAADEEYGDGDNDDEDDDDEVNLGEMDNEEDQDGNSTELGRYLGSPCEATCSDKLVHVFCDPNNRICECEKKYPVQIGVGRGCAKPKQLGDQCFYAQTCSFSDPNAICMQINHNAICQCKPGYHSVALRRGAKKSFCSEDQMVVSTDLPTLLGVATGIAVLTGLICFVLKLFNNNRFPDRRHYNNANIAPPLLLSSDNQWINGIPLTVHGRPSSRSSSQRSTTNLAQYPRSKGVLVPASRAGSRRPSLSSIKSTTSSQKSMSYSARRFEQENQQKEQRAAMRAAREETARHATAPTPSPLSTDGLLPWCGRIDEDDPLGFSSSAVKSASPNNGSVSELNTKLSPSVPAAPKT